jgi:hypothetical protein
VLLVLGVGWVIWGQTFTDAGVAPMDPMAEDSSAAMGVGAATEAAASPVGRFSSGATSGRLGYLRGCASSSA